MSDRWSDARKVWERAFAPLSAAGYRADRLADQDTYWQLHESTLRGDFPPEVFFDVGKLRGATVGAAQRSLEQTADGKPLRDFCAVYDGDELAAMFCGYQHLPGVYRMWHTNVAAAYRRRGIYRHILTGTISYTAELGFSRIVSDHAPGNNPVLLAKLGAGFRITSFEVEPVVGLSVCLTYFHNADELALYEYRCGLATMNARILGAGAGAIGQLKQQFAGE